MSWAFPSSKENGFDLMEVIMMNGSDGLDSIKAAWQLMQATTTLLQDAAMWQVVLRWAADDTFSFDDFLTEMADKFKERYRFDGLESYLRPVFEASHEGTAVGGCQGRHGFNVVSSTTPVAPNFSLLSFHPPVINFPYEVALPPDMSPAPSSQQSPGSSDGPLPRAKRSKLNNSTRRFIDTSALEDNEDEDKRVDKSDQDNEVDHRPRVTDIARAAGFISAHLKRRGMHCQTYRSLPRRIFVDAHNPLEVRVSLPPSHDTLVKDIVWIPTEELLSITQLCNIPVRSWVRILSGTFKHDIAYVLSVEDNSVEMLVVPCSLPYQPDFQLGDMTRDVPSCTARERSMCALYAHSLPQEESEDHPSLVDHTLARFSAQWWQDETLAESALAVCRFPEALEVSIYDFKLEFPIGASVKVIAGLGCGFQGIVISKLDDMFVLQGHDQQVPGIFLTRTLPDSVHFSRPSDQLQYDPLANEDKIQPGDLVTVVSGPHKGITGTLYYYSGHEMLITVLTRQQKDTDNLGAKGKSKARALEVADGNDNIDEDSNSLQVSVSIDDATVIPPPTLQFSMEKGYDVTVRDYVRVACSPAMGVEGPVHHVDLVTGRLTVLSEEGPLHTTLISFCLKVRDYSLQDQNARDAAVVGRTSCKVAIHSGLVQFKNTAVVTESGMLLNGAPLDAA
ncbi:hypothetical protein EDD16DRAFT_1717600 [Pisolithus croceorrhizus]|nr:hypothetical protein EDD16DRAFT_1717600 [Pisolithus croceorrhizus]